MFHLQILLAIGIFNTFTSITNGKILFDPIEVIRHPQNISALQGHPVILTCTFSQAVNCYWTHNGIDVGLENNNNDTLKYDIYSGDSDIYSEDSNNLQDNEYSMVKLLYSEDYRNTNDCTILIVSVSNTFQGEWRCNGFQQLSNQNITTNEAWITTYDLRASKEYSNVTVEAGTPMTLSCKFNLPVLCSWQAPSEEDLFLQLLSFRNNFTKDCTVNIRLAKYQHKGRWKCKGTLERLQSESIIQVNVTQAPESLEGIEEHPRNMTAFYATSIKLPCKFSSSVACSWEFYNSLLLHSGYTYTFNKGPTRDCSLTIRSFRSWHAGKYQCIGETDDRMLFSKEAWLRKKDTSDLKIVQHPESTNVGFYNSLVLKCIFSEPVDCAWEHNGLPTYRWRILYNNTKTRDCSLHIRSLHRDLIGRWQCRTAHYEIEALRSKNAWITLKNYFIQLEKGMPRFANFKLGQEVILECKFNTTTYCEWTHNSSTMYPGSLEEMIVYNNSNGKNTSDCSLKIKAFNVSNSGTYQCSSSSMAHHHQVSSGVSKISLESLNANIGIVQHPENKTIQHGQAVILECKFNIYVECIWVQHKGNTIYTVSMGDYNGHYQFVDTHRLRRDCTLEITSAKHRDKGLWTCIGKFSPDTRNVSISAYLDVEDVKDQKNESIRKLNMKCSSRENMVKCEFNTPAHCYWMYRENLQSKEFAVADVGTEKTCNFWGNFEIPGLYHVQGISMDVHEYAESEEYQFGDMALNRRPYESKALEGPQNATVNYGHSVTLTCKFEEPVKCIWMLGREVRFQSGLSHDNYRLPEMNIYQRDCSLTIINVQKSDIGHWKCQGGVVNFVSVEYHSRHSLTEKELQSPKRDAWITISKTPEDPQILSNTEIVTNTTILNATVTKYLHCVSSNGNPPADLQWRLNGEFVNGFLKVTATDDHIYTTKLFWDDSILVQSTSELLCIADHNSYDDLKYANVSIITAKKTLYIQSDFFKQPTLMMKNGNISTGQVLSPNQLDDLLCVMESDDSNQTLLWEYDGKQYMGTQETESKIGGTVEHTLHWNRTIPLQGNDFKLKCTTELHSSLQIQRSVAESERKGTINLAVILGCSLIAVILIAVLGFIIYKFQIKRKAPLMASSQALVDHRYELCQGSDGL